MTWSGPQGEIINQTGRHVRQSLELGTSTNSSEMSVKVHNGHVCQSNTRDVTSQLRDTVDLRLILAAKFHYLMQEVWPTPSPKSTVRVGNVVARNARCVQLRGILNIGNHEQEEEITKPQDEQLWGIKTQGQEIRSFRNQWLHYSTCVRDSTESRWTWPIWKWTGIRYPQRNEL